MVTTYKPYTPVDRSASAAEIAATPDSIKAVGDHFWVRSQNRPNVFYHATESGCSCPDFKKRGGPCKHVLAVGLHLAEEQERKAKANLPTCEHCKHQGEDVTTVSVYVGGHGHVEHVYCRDQVACWKRWDKAHGYAS